MGLEPKIHITPLQSVGGAKYTENSVLSFTYTGIMLYLNIILKTFFANN